LRLGAPQRRDELGQQVMRVADAAFLRDAELYRVIVAHDVRLRPSAE
jgi:hypothetical protein